METLFRSFDKGVVDIDFLTNSADDESAYDGEKQNVGKQGRVEGDRLLAHHPEKQRQATDECDHATEEKQQVALQDVDPLFDTDRQYGYQGGREGREHKGQEDIGRVCRPHLCPVGHDGDRDQRQSRSVDAKEHDHRITGGILLRVQFLQLFHGFQSHRRGGIVQA